LATPGRAIDSMSYLSSEGVLTGDALWVGAMAAPQGAGSSLEAARNSQREILFELPEETLVFPGHDTLDILFSKIGIEKRVSEREVLGSAWVAAPDDEIRARIDYNRQSKPGTLTDHRFGGGPVAVSRGLAVTTPQKAALKLREGGGAGAPTSAKLIDVREPHEFEQGHAAGALNWPLSEFSGFISRIAPSDRLYVYCEVGRRSVSAVRTLDRLGLGHATLIQGGYQGWKQAGQI
jgi:rhodanese-related sulfurtransferase